MISEWWYVASIEEHLFTNNVSANDGQVKNHAKVAISVVRLSDRGIESAAIANHIRFLFSEIKEEDNCSISISQFFSVLVPTVIDEPRRPWKEGKTRKGEREKKERDSFFFPTPSFAMYPLFSMGSKDEFFQVFCCTSYAHKNPIRHFTFLGNRKMLAFVRCCWED